MHDAIGTHVNSLCALDIYVPPIFFYFFAFLLLFDKFILRWLVLLFLVLLVFNYEIFTRTERNRTHSIKIELLMNHTT